MQPALQAAAFGSGVPISAPGRAALLSQFAFVRDVPGHPGAFVVRGPLGEQLFAERRTLGGTNQESVLAGMWAAAFHKPLPAGYKAAPVVEPGPKAALLVVIAIIAILIGLLSPPVRSAPLTASPNGPTLAPPDPSLWANALLH